MKGIVLSEGEKVAAWTGWGVVRGEQKGNLVPKLGAEMVQKMGQVLEEGREGVGGRIRVIRRCEIGIGGVEVYNFSRGWKVMRILLIFDFHVVLHSPIKLD